VRLEEERRDPRSVKARSRRNARERRCLAGHLVRVGGDDMARLALAASRLFAIERIGRKYRLRNDRYGQATNNELYFEVGGRHGSRPVL
jgi:hypothetical protein